MHNSVPRNTVKQVSPLVLESALECTHAPHTKALHILGMHIYDMLKYRRRLDSIKNRLLRPGLLA